MIIPLPANNDLVRISHLHATRGSQAALRYMDRVLENMASAGNAQAIPFRTNPGVRCRIGRRLHSQHRSQ